MTSEEAIKYAKDTNFCIGCPERMDMVDEFNPCDKCDHRMFFELVIGVLEKQMPKNAVIHEEQAARYVNIYKCPSCEKKFTGTGVVKYCYHCGQAIDWSEEE